MEPSAVDDYKILLLLATHKFRAKDDLSWDPTDDNVQRSVLSALQSTNNIDATKLKQRIEEFELMVRSHLEHGVQIVANKELLLDIFSCITSEIVPSSYEEPTRRVHSPPVPHGQKRTSSYLGEKDDIQHRSKRSSCSESVDHHVARMLDQRKAVHDILEGPINMEKCAEKLERCGFSGQLLWNAIDVLKTDLELRQVFMYLGEPEAKGYILHTLRNG